MISRLLVGAARILFAFGLVLLAAGAAAVYLAYRALRLVTVGNPPAPKREAAFHTLQAVVTLAHALRAGGGGVKAIVDELELDDETVLELFHLADVDAERIPAA